MSPINLKVFLKHLRKNKLYASITILGFSISLMFVILLSVYIRQEYSVDQFHVNKNRIFRLKHDDYSGFAPPSGPLLVNTFPEVETYTRTYSRDGYVGGKNNEKFRINYLMVDSSFFNMFSFRLITGQPESVLRERKSIVLTRSYALTLYGKLPEPGEIIKINDNTEYRLTGIMADLPENTHFEQIDAVVDFPSLADQYQYPRLLTTYDNNSYGLYIMAKPNTNFPTKATEILELFREVNWMYKGNSATEVVVESLTEVYFSQSYSPGIKQNSKTRIRVLSLVSLLVLLLSVINYINLTIAESTFRAKDIAIKKLLGRKKAWFVFQQVNESILLCMLSFFISIFLSFLCEPLFNYLLDTKINLSEEFNLLYVSYSILAIILIGVVSGIIPAFKISAFNPIEVVKGSFRMKEKKVYSRILISFQYLLICSLLMSAMFVGKQTRFMRYRNLGFQQDHIIWMDNTISPDRLPAFRNMLESIPGVQQICFVRGNPLDGGNNNSFTYKDRLISFQTFDVDTSFFRMMNMDVIPTGAAISNDMVWLNETAVKTMELPENPKFAEIYGREYPIYGIVKDFHFRDLRQTIGPAYFRVLPEGNWPWSILIKIANKNKFATLNSIKSEYKTFTDGLPISIGFMDESISQWYEQEERMGKLIGYFTIITIVISVMGLFAMSMYFVQQKVKEIGIRKVNGARISEVMLLLNNDFVKWVIIAFVLAMPVSYAIMNKWLDNFAYKTELSWWIFVLSGFFALAIAIFTISWQSWQAARKNPVEALRYE